MGRTARVRQPGCKSGPFGDGRFESFPAHGVVPVLVFTFGWPTRTGAATHLPCTHKWWCNGLLIRTRLGSIPRQGTNGPVFQRNGCLPVTETTGVQLPVGSPSRPLGGMDNTSDYGSEEWGFESLRGRQVDVAQWREHQVPNLMVGGSSPSIDANADGPRVDEGLHGKEDSAGSTPVVGSIYVP